jgi:hypothetical protein
LLALPDAGCAFFQCASSLILDLLRESLRRRLTPRAFRRWKNSPTKYTNLVANSFFAEPENNRLSVFEKLDFTAISGYRISAPM